MATTRMDAGVVLTAAAPADQITKTSQISTFLIPVCWMSGYVSHRVRTHFPHQKMSLFLRVYIYAHKALAIHALLARELAKGAFRTKENSAIWRVQIFLPSPRSPMLAFFPLQIPATVGILLIRRQRSSSDVYLLCQIMFKPQMQQRSRLMFRCWAIQQARYRTLPVKSDRW